MKNEYGGNTLPPGIRSRFIRANSIPMHVLEAGYESKDSPCVVLLHGFPELAYSWRNQMLPLADAGFHVLAPDLRGYGLSWGADVSFDDDLCRFTPPNHVSDILGLISASGYAKAAAVIGHDFGSSVAAWCALFRPDVFSSVVMMSSPFKAPPPLTETDTSSHSEDVYKELAALPRPRKHYQRYYATREANEEMHHPPQGVHNFLRAYYHYKSGDWKKNKPFSLGSWSAEELAKMPTYYIMELDRGMASTVTPEMPSASEIEACGWLTEEELKVYSTIYGKNGFQGGLQNYRVGADPTYTAGLRMFSGRTIDVPSCFIGGAKDWGPYQRPGTLEMMDGATCSRFQGTYFVDGAGHWVQQEQAAAVSRMLIDFLKQAV